MKAKHVLCVALGAFLATAAVVEAQAPRLLPGEMRRSDVLWVKFAEQHAVRLRGGRPAGPARGTLATIDPLLDAIAARGFAWSRGFPLIAEGDLDVLRQRAQARSGRAAPDQNSLFLLRVPAGEDGAEWLKRLSDRAEIEWVQGVELPVSAPVPPDFTASQVYPNPAPGGIGAWLAASSYLNGGGAGVRLCDVEYSWNLNHQDLPSGITLFGPAGVDPFADMNHGTAVLGEIASKNNGFGTRGLAPDVMVSVAAANTSSGYSVGAAINVAALSMSAGDVILIEQQTAGPNYTGIPSGTQNGLVPSEWNRSTYDAIRTVVMSGITVVEAAGNGAENLDAAVYQTGNNGHWPFLPQNDSGAIIVGAAQGTGGSARSRLSFSNYGSTVDLQGWGSGVWTTGYGNAYSSEGTNLWYTSGFSGTSSASPIVASAVCLMQSTAKAALGEPLLPSQVRQFLRDTGTPQTGNTAQNIGPLPNVHAAIAAAINEPGNPPGAFTLTSPATGATGVARPTLLNWTEATNAASYRLILDDDGDLSSPIVDASGLISPGYFVPGVLTQPLTTYYWMVVAHNTGGDTTGVPEIASFMTAGVAPGTFALASPADGADIMTLTPTLSWQPSSAADSYALALSTNIDLSSPLLSVSGIAGTSHAVPAAILADGVRYYWGVLAVNAFGQRSSIPSVSSFAVALPPCLGDSNHDRMVNFADISAVLGAWGQAGPLGDANADHHVDFVDVTYVLVQWLEPCP